MFQHFPRLYKTILTLGSNPPRSLLYIIYHVLLLLLLLLLLRSVFFNAKYFNADIGAWDTSAVTDMHESEYIRVVFYL